jgi:hypothetical protein
VFLIYTPSDFIRAGGILKTIAAWVGAGALVFGIVIGGVTVHVGDGTTVGSAELWVSDTTA